MLSSPAAAPPEPANRLTEGRRPSRASAHPVVDAVRRVHLVTLAPVLSALGTTYEAFSTTSAAEQWLIFVGPDGTMLVDPRSILGALKGAE